MSNEIKDRVLTLYREHTSTIALCYEKSVALCEAFVAAILTDDIEKGLRLHNEMITTFCEFAAAYRRFYKDAETLTAEMAPDDLSPDDRREINAMHTNLQDMHAKHYARVRQTEAMLQDESQGSIQ